MTVYFQINGYLGKSMKTNTMQIYENPFFDSNIFQTKALALN